MAFTSSHPSVSVSLIAPIGRFIAAIGNGLVALGEANPRYRQAQALYALNDAELAQRGLKREDIASAVFSNGF